MQSIKNDVRYILNSKYAIVTWYINLLFVLVNFMNNVRINYERIYISEMYEIPKLLLLSEWSVPGFFYIMIFPLIVVLPTHSLFIKDKKCGIDAYIKIRTKNITYCISKSISVFICTFLLFVFPLIIELGLSLICLERVANGDPSNFPYYMTVQTIDTYPFHNMYIWNKFLYTLLWIILFGLICGVLSVINLSIASFFEFKYSIFAMLPLYIVFNICNGLDSLLKSDYTLKYIYILRMFSFGRKNYLFLILTMLVVLIISMGVLCWRNRRE